MAAADERSGLTVATTPMPISLCGDAAETAIRAAAPAIPPCDEHTTVIFTAANTSAGTRVVVSWVDVRTAPPPIRSTIAITDGTVTNGLTAGVPTRPDDRVALSVGAILLAHGAPEIGLDLESCEHFVPGGFETYLPAIRLGVVGDHVLALAMRQGPPAADGEPTALLGRYDASVDESGVAHASWTPIAASAGSAFDVEALRALPPLAPAPRPTRVCGDAQEAAIRQRVPDLPACSDAPDAAYVAGPSRLGSFALVSWTGAEHAEHRAVAGARLFPWGAPDDLFGDGPSELLLLETLVAISDVWRLALDRTAAEALVGNDARRVLARLGAQHLGYARDGEQASLVAIGVHTDPDGTTRIEEIEATYADARVTDVRHRLLSRRTDAEEVEGAEDEAVTYYDDGPFGCLDGL